MLRRLLTVMYQGDAEAGRPYFTPQAIAYSEAGVANEAMGRFNWNGFRGRIAYVRHVTNPTPDTAFGVVLWRKPEAPPPMRTGAYDFVLRKENGKWLVFALRIAYVEPIRHTPVTEKKSAATGEWRSLFDGESMRGWVSAAGTRFPVTSWAVQNATLAAVARGGAWSLLTEEEFREFELEWEWKAAAGANSGVSYQLFAMNNVDVTGMEYQMVDDGSPAAQDPKQKSGALYGVVGVARYLARPVGEWNQSRIVLRGKRADHWLNGEKVAEYEVDGVLPSPIALQFHGAGVWFRNIRVREIQ